MRKDKMLRNTTCLIKNYRNLKKHSEKSIYEIKDIDQNIIDILDLMLNRDSQKMHIESIKKSVARTAIIMRHIDCMLSILESNSRSIEEQRRYRVIKSLYLDNNPMTVNEIALSENIDRRTVYRDRDCAIKELSALIFGIDGLFNK